MEAAVVSGDVGTMLSRVAKEMLRWLPDFYVVKYLWLDFCQIYAQISSTQLC